MRKVEIEKRLAILQNTYAASVAETVNTYDRSEEHTSELQSRT